MTMKPKFICSAMASTALMAAAPVMAQDSDVDLTTGQGLLSGWAGEASLSGSQTTGNTDTTDVGLAVNLAKEAGPWRHNVRGSADFGRANGENNKERYTLGYQIDRDITDRLYVYGNADWFSDNFGSFENGYFVGTGLGYKLVEPAPWGWDVEGGVGYRSQRPSESVVEVLDAAGVQISPGITQAEFDLLDADGAFDRQNEVGLRGASNITFDVNDNVSFYNNSEVIWSASDTYLWNEFGLTAQLTENLAARGSIRLDHHTDVLPGIENTDSITRFGIVYQIK